MALHKKFVGEFPDMSFADSTEQNYGILIGKNKDTKRILLSELKDYIDGSSNHLIVTARKQDDTYVVDRTYEEVLNAINNGVTPALRVIEDSNIVYFGILEYTNDDIVFGAPSTIIMVDDTERMVLPSFTYTSESFTDTTRLLPTTGVDVSYIDVN